MIVVFTKSPNVKAPISLTLDKTKSSLSTISSVKLAEYSKAIRSPQCDSTRVNEFLTRPAVEI